MDCRKIIEMLRKGQPASERQLRQVCKQFSEILVE
jgi:hypothetical protein